MAILHLEESKKLREHGKRLGRAGMSKYVIQAVAEFDGSYKGAIRLAGELHAIAIASKCNGYWHEKMREGYNKGFYGIQRFKPVPDEPEQPSRESAE